MGVEDDLNKKRVVESVDANDSSGSNVEKVLDKPSEVDEHKMESVNDDNDLFMLDEMKKKGSGSKIWVVLLLAIVCIAGFVGYKYFSSNPTEIIKIVLNNAYEDFSTELKKYGNTSNNGVDLFNESFRMSGSLQFKDEKHKGIEKEKINYFIGLDYKNKRAEMGANLTKENDKLVDINLFNKDDYLYMTSDTMFKNKYNLGEYKFNSLFESVQFDGELNSAESLSIEEIDFVVKELKDALVDALDDEKMKMSKETIDLNGKSVKTDKISYEIDYAAYVRVNNALIDSILTRDALLEKLAKMMSMDKASFKQQLENARLSKSGNSDEYGKVFFILNTVGVGHEVVKASFTDGISSMYMLCSDDKVQFIYDDIVSKTKTEVQISKKDERYEFIIYVNNKEILLLNIKEMSEDLFDMDYVYDYESSNLKGNVKVISKKKDGRTSNSTIDFSVRGMMSGEIVDYDITLDMQVDYGVEIAKDNLSNAIKTESLTDEDNQQMFERLMKLQNSALVLYFYELFGGMQM